MSKQRIDNPDILVASPIDKVQLAVEVERRFIQLHEDYLKIRKVALQVPEVLINDVRLWREMRARHRCKKCAHRRTTAGMRGIYAGVYLSPKDGRIYCQKCGGRGDYRHKEKELRATEEVASWTLQVNAALRGQAPIRIDWKRLEEQQREMQAQFLKGKLGEN